MKNKNSISLKDVECYWDEPKSFNYDVINNVTLNQKEITITNGRLYDLLPRLFRIESEGNGKIKFMDSGFAVTYISKSKDHTFKFKHTFDSKGNNIKEEVVGGESFFEATYTKSNELATYLRKPLFWKIDKDTNKAVWYLDETYDIRYSEHVDSNGNELEEPIYYKVNKETGEKIKIGA
jgi:hypothetical protein